MNREQRRKYERQLRRKGVSNEDVELFFKMLASSDETVNDGDKVRINVERIRKHPDYEKMNPKYKQFLADNEDKIFTATKTKKGFNRSFVEFEEDSTDPRWLWCMDDLIKVEGEETES